MNSLEEVSVELKNSRNSVQPFDEDIIGFLDSLSKKLLSRARMDASLAPLAFFIRKAHLRELQNNFQLGLTPEVVAVPQGVVFHIPPTNVDTLFLYTLALSLLAGNMNVIRISQNAGSGTQEILQILTQELEKWPKVSKMVIFVTFGRDEHVLNVLSQVCDVRMIWGGDETIKTISNTKTNLHAKNLSFPDRLSLSCIAVHRWIASNEESKQQIVEGLYNDSYWFDQMACSSPQQVILISDYDNELVESVKQDIFARLDEYASRKYEYPEGHAINKMVALVNAFALGANHSTWESNLTVLVDGLALESTEYVRPGAGFFGIQHMRCIDELIPQINRKVQTLSYFGFEKDELISFVHKLNGVGIDRVVPIGKALDFANIWDGKNLLHEMHRLVTIE